MLNELLISRRFELRKGDRKKPKPDEGLSDLHLPRSLDLLPFPLPLHQVENEENSLCNLERSPHRQQHQLSVFLRLRQDLLQLLIPLLMLLRPESSYLLLLEVVHLLGVSVPLPRLAVPLHQVLLHRLPPRQQHQRLNRSHRHTDLLSLRAVQAGGIGKLHLERENDPSPHGRRGLNLLLLIS